MKKRYMKLKGQYERDMKRASKSKKVYESYKKSYSKKMKRMMK